MDITQDIKGVFDNGGMYNDRYTIVFNDMVNENLGTYLSLGLSEDPEDPEGVSIWTESSLPNSYLGERIEFAELSDKLKKYVEKQYFGKTATLMEVKAMSNYRQEAQEDAKDFVQNFMDEIVEQIMENQKASDDWNNDYPDGDSYFHESFVDKDYDLKEAAQLLDELDEFEVTDRGLWEGQEPRRAIATQAAFTYGNAVGVFISDLIADINSAMDSIVWPDDVDPEDEKLKAKVKEKIEEVIR